MMQQIIAHYEGQWASLAARIRQLTRDHDAAVARGDYRRARAASHELAFLVLSRCGLEDQLARLASRRPGAAIH